MSGLSDEERRELLRIEESGGYLETLLDNEPDAIIRLIEEGYLDCRQHVFDWVFLRISDKGYATIRAMK